MQKLTEDQKYENALKRKIKSRIKKNKTEKYPRPFDVLAHTFWVDFPKFRNEKLDTFEDKIQDKIRLTMLFEHLAEQI